MCCGDVGVRSGLRGPELCNKLLGKPVSSESRCHETVFRASAVLFAEAVRYRSLKRAKFSRVAFCPHYTRRRSHQLTVGDTFLLSWLGWSDVGRLWRGCSTLKRDTPASPVPRTPSARVQRASRHSGVLSLA